MTNITNGGVALRFLRAYSAVFSITLLAVTLPTGWSGLVHARSIADAVYSNRIGVDDRLWIALGGFVLGIALAQALYTRARTGRLRAYEFAVAVFLGLWFAAGAALALASAEWGGVVLALGSGIIAPLVPWTDSRTALRRRVMLSLIAVAAVASATASSAEFFDSGFLFFMFAAPLAGLGGALGILGAERIVERERVVVEVMPPEARPGGRYVA